MINSKPSTSPRLFSYQPLDAAAKVEERKRSGFDKLCGYALAWINTLSWFVGAATETQEVLIDPQLSSLLLACLKLFFRARSAAKFKSQSAGRKQYRYWKHMWLRFDSFLKRKQQLRPRIYVPTPYRRWTIEDRFVQSPRGYSVIATFALFRRAVEFQMESISTPEDELVRSVIDRTATYQSWSDGCFGSEEKKAFCNYFFDYLCLCQSIYCRTSCPFCLQVRSLKQKRLRRRANKSRKEKIPARRSPGALIRHSKNNFSKKTDDFSLTVLDTYLTYLKHFEPSRVRLVECGPLLGSQSRPSGRAGKPPAVGINSHRATASERCTKNMSDGFGMVILLVEFLLLILFRLVYDIKIMLCVVFLQHILTFCMSS